MSHRVVRSVGFVVNVQKAKAVAITSNLADLLSARGIEFFAEREVSQVLGIPAADESRFRTADLCIVLGGDGTMIRAARLLENAEVPLLGIHLGSLGFMMEHTAEEASFALENFLNGVLDCQPRLKLSVQVFSGSPVGPVPSTAPRFEALALNEVAVNKGVLSRIIQLKTSIDGFFVTCFRADGVIVSTPTGSTGYSLSAGGAILAPTLSAIAVTPICPHSLAQRPLVIPGESQIELTLLPGSSEVFLSIDGQQSRPLLPFDRICIREAKSHAILVRHQNLDFFSILRSRLGWGGGR